MKKNANSPRVELLENFKKILIFLVVSNLCFFGKDVFGDEEELRVISKPVGIEISWTGLDLNELESVVLLKKKGGCPKNIYEGEEVYRGNGDSFLDRNTNKGEKYCYALAVSDKLGNFSGILSSQEATKKSALAYYLDLIKYNYILVVGPFIIIILFFLDRFTRKRDMEEMKRKEKFKVIKEA